MTSVMAPDPRRPEERSVSTLPLLHAGPEAPRAPRGGLPLLAKGFRPFFLLGALHAAIWMPLWVLVLRGDASLGGLFDAPTTHAHEMVFGLTTAVIAGFLLTAVGNWTGRETATGWQLGALVALWAAGRVAVPLGGVLPKGLVAAVELAFLPMLAFTLARPLVATGNRRNYVMLGALGLLWAADVAMVLDALGVVAGGTRPALAAAVDVAVALVVLVSTRIFPMFTRNATRDESVRNVPLLDKIALVALLPWLVLDVARPGTATAGIAAIVLSVALAVRSATWGAWTSRGIPLLTILHASNGFVVLGLALRGLAPFVPRIPPSSATHALTVGALGAAMLGMMARVALGHSGRPLVPPRSAVVAFGLLGVAAVVRVGAPFFPELLATGYAVSGLSLSVAFLLYVVGYAGILSRPRADGKPG